LIILSLYAFSAEENIEISRYEFNAQYYGLPLIIKGGYYYRKNDFSFFPNIGTSFAPLDIISGNVFSSFSLIYKQLKVEPSFQYELFSSDMKEKDGRQIYYVQNIIKYGFNDGGLFFLAKYGKNRWHEYFADKISGLQILDTLDLGIGLDLFLFDTGLLRGDIKSVVSYHYIPYSGFNSYDIRLDIPVTFSLYHVDINIIYTYYYTGVLDFNRIESNKNYVIEKSYSYITGRYSFTGNESRYKLLNLLEIENRWYFLRGLFRSSNSSNIFVSIFGNLGLGIDRSDSPALLGQIGIGIGYLLFDCVPFTFQAGFDTGGKLVVYTGVVSRISYF
jgi:hypothetical protein